MVVVRPHDEGRQQERALLLHQGIPGVEDEGDLSELRLLAESTGALVCDTVVCRQQRPVAATFIGKGKAELISQAIATQAIDLVLINHDLSPGQQRNLERIFQCRVLDRTGLILDIFAQRAHSHEGKLQVELAQLEHLSTRLVRGWTHLERQKGGIGLRGPGETQLETDRRLIRERIKRLHRRLQKVRNQRRIRRKSRNKVPIPTVALVGYTNAGKSTLFNRLTGAETYTADQLFATLDPTMRRLVLPGNLPVVLADTVGFIRNLPHDLIEAFKSTLEEVEKADLLIHVVDFSNPEHPDQIQRVNEVLAELEAGDIPQLIAFNKIDLINKPPQVVCNQAGQVSKIWLSAANGHGLSDLLEALAEYYKQQQQLYTLRLPLECGRLRAMLYSEVEVISEKIDESGCWIIDIALDPAKTAWLERQPDFNDDFILASSSLVLAPTGS